MSVADVAPQTRNGLIHTYMVWVKRLGPSGALLRARVGQKKLIFQGLVVNST